MINDLYRLNMEVVLTANKMRATGPGAIHDELIRKMEQQRRSLSNTPRESRIWKLCKRILLPRNLGKVIRGFFTTTS